MTPKLLVVLGATGAQGGSVVNSFLDEPGWRLRAISRDPSKPAAIALSSKGVEVVRGDASDIASLRAAFTSASAIFALTDFWGNFATASGLQLGPDEPPNKRAGQLEIQQAKNIFDAAAEIKGLERLVWSSLPSVTKQSGGKFTRGYHFDAKAVGDDYLYATYPELAKKTSIAQVGMYAENHVMMDMFKPQKTPSGSFALRFPFPPETPLPYIIASTQVGYFVKPLITSTVPAGANLRVASANMSMTRFLELWSKVTGVDAHFEQITPEEFGRPLGPPLDVQMIDVTSYLQEFGFFGKDNRFVGPEEIGIELPGEKSIEAWIKNTDWSGILGSESSTAVA